MVTEHVSYPYSTILEQGLTVMHMAKQEVEMMISES